MDMKELSAMVNEVFGEAKVVARIPGSMFNKVTNSGDKLVKRMIKAIDKIRPHSEPNDPSIHTEIPTIMNAFSMIGVESWYRDETADKSLKVYRTHDNSQLVIIDKSGEVYYKKGINVLTIGPKHFYSNI